MIRHNVEFPYVHDLSRLLDLLEEAGEEVPERVPKRVRTSTACVTVRPRAAAVRTRLNDSRPFVPQRLEPGCRFGEPAMQPIALFREAVAVAFGRAEGLQGLPQVGGSLKMGRFHIFDLSVSG